MISRNIDGKVQDNFFQAPEDASGIRRNLAQRGYVQLDHSVTPDMTIVIKHPAAFTALAPDLMLHYPTFALIRHPLWALASWSSNDFPINRGRLPMAEQIDLQLAAALDAIPDRIDRQIHLLSWMFERYSRLRADQIIRYEDVVVAPGKALKVIVPAAAGISEQLSNQNRAERYPGVPLDELRGRLMEKGGAFFDFYPDPL